VRFWEILRLLPVHTSTKQQRAGMQVKILASTSFDSSTFLKFLKGLGWKKTHFVLQQDNMQRYLQTKCGQHRQVIPLIPLIMTAMTFGIIPCLSWFWANCAFEYAVGRCVVDAFFP
jgi:hypothetical protein